LVAIESQIRVAVRDAVNRESRKPFQWGGLKGYQQLDAIAKVLHEKASPVPPGKASPVPSGMVGTSVETAYFQQLIKQVDRALEQNRELADGLQEAHIWLRRIAACLRYPPRSYPDFDSLTSQQIAQEMDALLKELCQQAQAGHQVLKSLYSAVDYRWKLYGQDLLPCYDIPGLPSDNLQLESLFNHLRCHQRRISGRKSTKELRDFGQYQVLFMAESEGALLEQLRLVPISEYRKHRQQLAQAEVPRQFLYRLHRDPAATIQKLADRHSQRQIELTNASRYISPHTV
jgi:hypothetical protein